MKIIDDFHPVHYEVAANQRFFKEPEKFGMGSTQKIYAFPNGYGASVVQGFFTFDYPELAVLIFDKPFRLRSKKKRHLKKYFKKYGLLYDMSYDTPITQDVKRYANQKDLTDDLNRIANL